MSVHLLALRERVRSWVNRMAVSAGVVCIHAIDLKAWRPCKTRCNRKDHGGACVMGEDAARVCRYCDTIERLTPGEFYAYFNRPFIARDPSWLEGDTW